MKEIKIRKTANNILWVEHWINVVSKTGDEYSIEASRYDDYRWICEIKLPLIKKTITAVSEKEVYAMVNAANKAARIINKYMKEHKRPKVKNVFRKAQWVIEGDEQGNFVSMGPSENIRKRRKKEWDKIIGGSLDAIQKAITKINSINGYRKSLFIQVLNQSLFASDKPIKDILEQIHANLERDYNVDQMSICYDRYGDSVIAVGFVFPKNTDTITDNENVPVI